MRRLIGFYGIMAFFMIVGCAMLQIGQPQYKSFDLTIDEEKVVVNLPDEIPDMANAILGWHRCWNVNVCGIGFDLQEECCIHYVNFWYSGKTVFGIIYIDKRVDLKVLAWFYHNGKLTRTTLEKFQARLYAIYEYGLKQPTDEAKDI